LLSRCIHHSAELVESTPDMPDIDGLHARLVKGYRMKYSTRTQENEQGAKHTAGRHISAHAYDVQCECVWQGRD
jgi:hypothetical protein